MEGSTDQKFGGLPPHLVLPMLLMKQNMKNAMLGNLNITRVKSEYSAEPKVFCPSCGRGYKLKSSLRNHMKWECGKEPQFKCPHCSYRAKQKMHITRHIERMHKVLDGSAVKTEDNVDSDDNGENAVKKEVVDDGIDNEEIK
ncbi:unnamed protein product [Phyllotreta striolata]|uniref:C2H2-type domain-containing protein n=1 Tax=Phyllotreta striolata TaxID=444603 RepID=A0A9N9TZZ4_PHYSR|nr:unnamed protein product [Phyllotreta striolata]